MNKKETTKFIVQLIASIASAILNGSVTITENRSCLHLAAPISVI